MRGTLTAPIAVAGITFLTAACELPGPDPAPEIVETKDTRCWSELSTRSLSERDSSIFVTHDGAPPGADTLAVAYGVGLTRILEMHGAPSTFACVALPDDAVPTAELLSALQESSGIPAVPVAECVVDGPVTHPELGDAGVQVRVQAVCAEADDRLLMNVTYGRGGFDAAGYTYDLENSQDGWSLIGEGLRGRA